MKEEKQKEILSFTKKIILFILIISEVEILLSYILAFCGREVIAESLSAQVVITCLGGLGFYMIKALIENISKYTTFFDRGNKNEECNDNIDDIDSVIDECDNVINEENID